MHAAFKLKLFFKSGKSFSGILRTNIKREWHAITIIIDGGKKSIALLYITRTSVASVLPLI